MVGSTMKKALKILEPRRTRERKEEVPVMRLNIIDPSHELSLQRQRPNTSHNEQSYAIHPMARHSNPELQTPKTKWSSASSVASLDRDSMSQHCDDLDDDLELFQYDLPSQMHPTRRRSTGSSRQKSQQKLAKILGWNTSFPQTQTPTQTPTLTQTQTRTQPQPRKQAHNKREQPRTTRSVENLQSPVSSRKNTPGKQSPVNWNNEYIDSSVSEAGSCSSKKRRSSSVRSNSIKSTSSRSGSDAYDYQMRQFSSARYYDNKERPHTRERSDNDTYRSESPNSTGTARRGSNPNVHKPLPTTPSFPSFPSVHPLSQSSLSSTSTPVSAHNDDFSALMDLSAEEASVLLSQPEPSELPSDSFADRAELPVASTKNDTAAPRVRSKSPTQTRSSSAASTVNDFGPGTTLSIIEEEPWSTEDLADFKVFELPAVILPTIPERSGTAQESETSCPGLSPSSSMSSRKMRSKDAETEEKWEDRSRSAPTEGETDGEEIVVIFDRRPKPQSANLSEKSFLSLEDDSEDDNATDTEESVRNSYRQSRPSSRGWPLPGESEEESNKRSHRASVETTKTAYTTSSERTIVNPDFSNDLAKRMDWF